MIIDLHLHESKHSPDSRQTLEQAIERALELNLDGIAVTNHDNRNLALERGHFFMERGLRVFVGNEVYTDRGDILVFGEFDILDHDVNHRIPYTALLDLVSVKNGATIAAHPYRHNRRGIGDVIFQDPRLTAVEAYNGSTFPYDNYRALQAARKAGLPVTGAGDSHRPEKLGVFATRFFHPIHSYEDFIQALRSGEFVPVVRRNGSYIDLSDPCFK